MAALNIFSLVTRKGKRFVKCSVCGHTWPEAHDLFNVLWNHARDHN